MKVLIVTNVYLRAALNQGQASFVKDQIDAIHKYHPDVDFTTYTIHGLEHKSEYLKSLYEVPKLINSGEFDLVHIHYGISGLFRLFMGKPKIPIVVTLHGGDIQRGYGHPYQIALTKKIIKRCDYVFSLNELMKSIVEKYNSNTEIVPISVDMKTFKPAEKVRPIGYKDVTIIFPASLNREVKDHPLFLSTIKTLHDKYGYNVNEVDFDNISHEEVRQHYQKCDLVLLSSKAEGSPGVIKESMACNLPIVCTNVGDVAVLLKGVENCAVAKGRSPEELAELCDKCLKHDIPGITGRERLNQLGYDDKSISDKTYAIYTKLIKAKKGESK